MKKRALLSVVLISSILFSAFAIEDSKKGIEFYKFGALEPAKIILLNSYKTGNGNRAEVSYYLGEIYFAENNRDSSAYYFKDSFAANPEYIFNEIGIAKLQFKNNPAAAEASLKKIADRNKKRADVLVAVAKAYFQNDQKAKAFENIEKAKKANMKYAEIYVLEGDIHAASKDLGKASGSYEQALRADPDCKEAYVRYANIYTSIQPTSSIEVMERLIAIDPSSPLAQMSVADAYYNAGQFGKAAAAYAKYAASEYSSPSDLARYATILFYGKDYVKSSEIVNSALKKNPNDFVMTRLLMYNEFEQKKYTEGLATAERFMNMKGNQNFIWLDYVYYGRLLQENKKPEEAIAQFEKAREADPSKADIHKEIASVYESMGDYDKAIASYEAFMKEGSESASSFDYYSFGRICYFAAIEITGTDKESQEKRLRYLTRADALFAVVAEKSPDSHLGNYWRGHTNVAIDPEAEQGLAKPYYEAALVILNANSDKYAKQIIDCCSYLGYYHYIKGDKATSKSYYSRILELDPTNEKAIRAVKEM